MTQSTNQGNDKEIIDSPFQYDRSIINKIDAISTRVLAMRKNGQLSSDALKQIRKHFRIKNIYHSNAIEGNLLDVGETRQVVEMGLTIAGKPLKDQAEAKNLGHALDFLEELAKKSDMPISVHEVRQIHALILKSIDDDNAGTYRKVTVEISGSDYKPPEPHDVSHHMQEFNEWLQIATENVGIGCRDVLEIAAACHAVNGQNN